MVFRAVLAIWFLATSVFAPATCCCAPLSFGSTVQAEAVEKPIQTTSAKKPCSHCKKEIPAQQTAPKDKGKHPCPADPSRDHCPCQDHHVLDSALVTTADLGINHSANRLIEFCPFCVETFYHAFVANAEHRPADYTGPPPLAGIELLHRLHILNC